MITIVCGTNRKDAVSKILSRIYQQLLNNLNSENTIVDLSELPSDFAFSALYDKSGKNEVFNVIRQQMRRSEKFVFIVPEYNCSSREF